MCAVETGIIRHTIALGRGLSKVNMIADARRAHHGDIANETFDKGALRHDRAGGSRACAPGRLVSLGEIAERQDVSLAYLEQLFVKLRRAGLVASVRGPGGGYRLARAADVIRVSDILEAVDETVSAMDKGAGAKGAVTGSRAQSLTNRLWEGLSAHVYVFLHQARLSDVAATR